MDDPKPPRSRLRRKHLHRSNDEPWLVRYTPHITAIGIILTGAVAAFGLRGPVDGLIWYGKVLQNPDITLKVATGIAAAFLAIAALGKYELSRIQNQHAKEQVRIAEQSQINDRFTRAVEQLGHEKASIRLGAIYALEHIAKDSPSTYGQTVVDVLSGHVREHRPIKLWVGPKTKNDWLDTDKQSALTVIGRSHDYAGRLRIDLGSTDLFKARLNHGKFAHADLTRSNLTRADLAQIDLTGSDLSRATLHRADLTGAEMTSARLYEVTLTSANLTDANLTCAVLTRANLSRIDLTGANLLRTRLDQADLRGANLSGAVLTGADLRGANLSSAVLTGADLRGANLSSAVLTDADLTNTKSDGSTIWPDKLPDPEIPEVPKDSDGASS